MFTIVKEKQKARLVVEESAWSGVRRIADKVAGDLKLVTGRKFAVKTALPDAADERNVILAATIGRSGYLEELERAGRVDLTDVRGKREVYLFRVLPKAAGERHATLLIAGSDKRGTIYGLFHLSELIGVSPWVWFADVEPAHQAELTLKGKIDLISREPSVKYRGFFINDEWPSFGKWTFEHFGGFTAEMYDHVFELLLRLKGNYLWPAMWSSSFSLDGPGMASALLADEYGIVMSNSHHEPCLRHSEEWDLVRGEDSVYGNAWNFDRNREGLKNYWRDGLRRNGHLENIITIGMRGERDSEILGHSATLRENIEYLKEVITTQHQLIRECVNENLDEVPRMLALYKEVEAYFYGDESCAGLKDWEELDGVTFMLCEDNYGNMRTLPPREMRERRGGWGMYYHFDYHGEPVSYEWVNSTHLTKVWEQMTQAYEYGVRDIWVVNVGDLKPQELPLSYFLDLAYDYDTWGISALNRTEEYTRRWIRQQFPTGFSKQEQNKIYELLDGYTKLNSIRRPEALRPDTYHPVNYGEADFVLHRLDSLEEKANRLWKKHDTAAFYELVYYPAVASLNQIRMMIHAGKNELCARQGKLNANLYGLETTSCYIHDRELRERYHTIAKGKWSGMMSSEHVGFAHWNDEECAYPPQISILPANKPRLIVSGLFDEQYTMGGDWTRRTLRFEDFLDPQCTCLILELARGSRGTIPYTVTCDAPWLILPRTDGTVKEMTDLLVVEINRTKVREETIGRLCIKTDFAHVDVEIPVRPFTEEELADPHYVPDSPEIGLAIEADEFETVRTTGRGAYAVLEGYGKYRAGIKAFPVTEAYVPGQDAPSAVYAMTLPRDDTYEVTLRTSPSNPVSAENHMRIGWQWNDGPIEVRELIGADYRAGAPDCAEWAQGVLDNIRDLRFEVSGRAGHNTLTIYACDPCVLERILIKRAGIPWKKGFIGKMIREVG